MRQVITLFFALVLSACVSAPTNQPSQLASLLLGTWAMTTEINGARIEAQTTFSSNGNVEEHVKVTQNGAITNISARGNWTVDGDTIVTTYTESDAPTLVAVGSVERDKVTFIDANQLSLVDAEGTAGTMHRVR